MSFFGFDTSLPQRPGETMDEKLRRMAAADENLWVCTITLVCIYKLI